MWIGTTSGATQVFPLADILEAADDLTVRLGERPLEDAPLPPAHRPFPAEQRLRVASRFLLHRAPRAPAGRVGAAGNRLRFLRACKLCVGVRLL